MSDQDKLTSTVLYEAVPLVIADGDEGVQLNHGRRFAFVGAGFNLKHFKAVVTALSKTIKEHFPSEQTDKKLKLVASEENAWFKKELDLNDWDETNASMQQHLAALADQVNLTYAGILPFADPEELAEAVKGHMVRPHNMHLANKICFTLGGGEEVYNLGQYLISADWLTEFTANGKKNLKEAQEILQIQVDFYQALAKNDSLAILVEETGPLGPDLAASNKQILQKLHFLAK